MGEGVCGGGHGSGVMAVVQTQMSSTEVRLVFGSTSQEISVQFCATNRGPSLRNVINLK
jgi:hypothetical protein